MFGCLHHLSQTTPNLLEACENVDGNLERYFQDKHCMQCMRLNGREFYYLHNQP